MASHNDVNQRLYCCRLQIEHYQQLLEQADLPVMVVHCLAGEAAVYHLQALYTSYLVELSEQYHIAGSFISAEQLSRKLQSSEVSELVLLESDSSSWLSQLLNFSPGVNQPQHLNVIASTVSDASTVLSAAALQATLVELKQLIETQRALSQEW